MTSISVTIDGVTETHVPSPTGVYATLCALDGDDPRVNQSNTQASNDPVSRRDCWVLWTACRRYKAQDFTVTR